MAVSLVKAHHMFATCSNTSSEWCLADYEFSGGTTWPVRETAVQLMGMVPRDCGNQYCVTGDHGIWGRLPEKGDELENHCCHRKKMGLNV